MVSESKMREILFRGKLAINNEWAFSRCPDGLIHSGVVGYDFIPETVGQFTGLHDKNGKRIFEGDVVEISHDAYPGVKGEVFFKSGSFMLKNVGDVLTLYGFLPWCEVTGNIHDNPELLEVSHV